jgi:hypothetical protein
VASPAEDSVVIVAAEIQDTQTAKEPFGGDAVAHSLGDADATNTAGTTVVKAPKLLKDISSKGPNIAAIDQSGQDQGRVHLLLDFFRLFGMVLITKEVFKAPNAAVADLTRL